jgi:phage host-nuclease inhibitor protein Gam
MKTYNPIMKIAVAAVKDITAEQFNMALEQYGTALQNETTLKQVLEQELDEIRKKYAPGLTCLEYNKNSAYAAIETYCLEQKATLFAHRRSIGTPYGIVGFRLGTPRLRIRKGYNQKVVLELLAAKLPEYIRTTMEPAKALLVAHRHTEKVAVKLHEAGLEIVQDDLFYIHKPTPQAFIQTA